MGTQSVPPKGSPGTASAPSPIMSFMPMIVICAILYLLVIRPQQKASKDHRKMVDNLKSGDRVLTSGGIFGTVTALKGNIVQVKIADNVKVDVNRASISQVMTETTNGTPAVISGEKNS